MSEFAESIADASTREAKDFPADRNEMLKGTNKIYWEYQSLWKKKMESCFESFKFTKSLRASMLIC